MPHFQKKTKNQNYGKYNTKPKLSFIRRKTNKVAGKEEEENQTSFLYSYKYPQTSTPTIHHTSTLQLKLVTCILIVGTNKN